MTQWHRTLNDDAFSEQFNAGTYPVEHFTHEAHIRLAWIHLTQFGESMAISNVTNQIKKFVAIHGASDKYHETLTVAAVKTVFHFLQRSSKDTFESFIEEFPRLTLHFKDLLDAHYSPEVLHTEEARYQFLEPDLLPYS